jgi:hypothetical protein
LSTDLATASTNEVAHVERVYATSLDGGVYTWRIYDGSGKIVDPKPMQITNISCAETNALISATGETGRWAKLLEGTSPAGPWYETGTNVVIRPYGRVQVVKRPASSTNAFFKLLLLDTVPNWTQ